MKKKTAASSHPVRRITREEGESAYLDLFYPIHYMVGIRIEDTLRSNTLSRQQTCILWMIRMQGIDGKVMRRKDIERALVGWFETTSSTVSKSLQSLSKQLGLVKIAEDPASAREKLVSLTPKGERFLLEMIRNGKTLMKWMIDRLDDDEVSNGVHFLSRVTEVFASFPGADEAPGVVPRRRG